MINWPMWGERLTEWNTEDLNTLASIITTILHKRINESRDADAQWMTNE